ncbi:MAG: M20/M25/M40 family metallo-hydrolase [Desulfobulbaceae bacterium]|jgi:tripeptide aminopeptidase|nr:M20/M25/M40 family metallo-hydrolase [Desulfobulbaceae bacterium]MDH3866102.1 M20/M25/M40 family metallo-hydrolase [Desulfobulbaceae bacterium]MDH3996297.1 M20/M25/M40 family metallo-hydrolase [Desulfobulbaceae bacterium]
MKINRERLASVFTTLCEIDSPSKQEGRVAVYLKALFTEMGAEVFEDDSASRTGSDCGNLFIRFPESGLAKEPVFFNCHMDTVLPAIGVKVKREGEVFSSAGDTVLGSDDKAGIAALIEVMRTLQEKNIPHGPVEYIFTTCEEVGLLGVKALDPSLIKAKIGYALDSSGINRVVIGAPAANRITAEVKGLASHAGLSPEKGISAIQLAARAIARLKLGRLDPESTANIGVIEGGTASNIIPESALVQGEVRSHNVKLLQEHTAHIRSTFEEEIATWSDPEGVVEGRPSLDFTAVDDFPILKLDRDSAVIKRVEAAAALLDRELHYVVAGGGSDANIFNGYGLQCAILSTGMDKVHSTRETIKLSDMALTADLIMAILL